MPELKGYPQKNIMNGLVTLPGTGTDLTTTDSVIFQIVLCNFSAGTVTVTITDKASSPHYLCDALSLTASTTTVLSFPSGVTMSGGINWTCSAATSVDGEIFGVCTFDVI